MSKIKSGTTTRRANGEGSWYQKPDKTWVHQITMGRKENGSLDRKTFSGKTKRECIEKRDKYNEEQKQQIKRKQAEQESQIQNGHFVDSEAYFSEAFPKWLKLYKYLPSCKATTYSGYLDIYEDHFEEFFGASKLFEITQDVVQEYYNKKKVIGGRKDRLGHLSPKTIQNHHMLLKEFFEYCLEKYKLESNPAVKTIRPRVVIPEMRVLTPDEMVIFMEEVLLRHTFATRLAEQSVPIDVIQKILGHAQSATTKRYITTFEPRLKEAVEDLSVFLSSKKLDDTKQINLRKDSYRFQDVRLPSWLEAGGARI